MDERAIEHVMAVTDRENFIPDELEVQAKFDIALPIGFDQTISQPSTVKAMLKWLDVELGNLVLDIGSGSGWTTALLSKLVGPKGFVYAVERIPELVEAGKSNCLREGVRNAKFYKAGKTLGLKKFAPYDRILVSASAKRLPYELLDQLKTDGKLIIPVKNDILEIEKNDKDNILTTVHPGYVFVPLIVE